MHGKATTGTFERRVAPNVTERHGRTCRRSTGGRSCTCTPSYLATVSVGGRGERRKHKRTFPSLADATAWVEDTRRGISRGEDLGDSGAPQRAVPTVADAVPGVLARMVHGEVMAKGGHPYSRVTIENYTGSLERDVLPFHVERYGCRLGDLRADLVDQKVMQALVDALAAEGRRKAAIRAKAKADRTGIDVKPGTGSGTARQALAALMRVLKDLEQRGIIDGVPSAPTTTPAPPKPRTRRLGMDEVARIVDAAYADDEAHGRSLLGPMLMLASRTGARRKELCGLRWGEDGVMVSPALDDEGEPLTNDEGQPIFTGYIHIRRETTKSDAGERTVALDPGTAAALHRHRVACGMPDDGTCTLVNPPRVTKRGRVDAPRPISNDTLRAGLTRISAATGVPDLGTHLFRHSYTSWAVETGENHVAVAARLGHSDPAFTFRHYAHADKDRIATQPLDLGWDDVRAKGA